MILMSKDLVGLCAGTAHNPTNVRFRIVGLHTPNKALFRVACVLSSCGECGNVLPRKDKPRISFINLAEDGQRVRGCDESRGKEYHMDHIKQPCTANKRGVGW